MTAVTVDLDAYFKRIAYTGSREPTLRVLHDLHLRHVCAVPFENLDVLLGRDIRLDVRSLEAKIIGERRGGYCFEQNGLFAAVLQALGFEVTPLAARVRWKVPAGTILPRTHMTLLVTCEKTRYLADVGFGGLSLSAPIVLDTGAEQRTPHQPRRLREWNGEYIHQAWRNNQWMDVYAFTLEPQTRGDYEMANWYTSTHPASRFRQNLVVALAATDRHYTLANHEFSIRHVDGRVEKRTIDQPQELLEVLRTTFGLHFPAETRFGPPGSPWPS